MAPRFAEGIRVEWESEATAFIALDMGKKGCGETRTDCVGHAEPEHVSRLPLVQVSAQRSALMGLPARR